MSKRSKKSELRVVFDTSAIFTDSSSDLFQKGISDLISANAHHPELVTRWYLPKTVADERQYQMRKSGANLLPQIAKMEKIIGTPLNISEDLIDRRTRELVESHAAQFGVSIQSLDVQRVDWQALIENALQRRPPFSPGEKEKGFRDALILEMFEQLVEDSPATPQLCRVCLVSGDGLLCDAAEVRCAGRANVRIFRSVDDLAGLINTLVSQVSEEYVARLKPKADAAFYTRDDQRTLWYADHIRERLSTEYASQLQELPSGISRRENEGLDLEGPQFVKKEGQIIHWRTRVSVRFKTYVSPKRSVIISDARATPGSSVGSAARDSNVVVSPTIVNPAYSVLNIGGDSFSYPNNILLTNSYYSSGTFGVQSEEAGPTGKSVLDVYWTVKVITSGRLRDAKVDRIEYAGMTIDQ